MIKIISKDVDFHHSPDRPFQALLAQIPVKLVQEEYFFRIAEPARQWKSIEAILEMASGGGKAFADLDFIAFPESALPLDYLEEMLGFASQKLPKNTVLLTGMEQTPLGIFYKLVKGYSQDNDEALAILEKDMELEEYGKPVNWFITTLKDNSGTLHCYLEAKTHPFYGEEYLDKSHDLYQGKHIYLFKSSLSSLNFITLICFDYVYRDLHHSNIMSIINEANEMYFNNREQLDFLFVIQFNPKPEHRVFADTVTGFYGEYLTFTPGVRNTTTIFLNTSCESTLPGIDGGKDFGYSSVVVNKSNRLHRVSLMEFSTDDFGGAPVCRLRFGHASRLYHLSLSRFHEHDPRGSRTPVKVLNVYRFEEDKWKILSGRELVDGSSHIISQSGGE